MWLLESVRKFLAFKLLDLDLELVVFNLILPLVGLELIEYSAEVVKLFIELILLLLHDLKLLIVRPRPSRLRWLVSAIVIVGVSVLVLVLFECALQAFNLSEVALDGLVVVLDFLFHLAELKFHVLNKLLHKLIRKLVLSVELTI